MASKEKETKKKEDEHAGEQIKDKGIEFLKKVGGILLLACIIFLGLDGYFNRWGFVRTMIDWNTLELEGVDGSAWRLKAKRDFKVLKIEDTQPLVTTAGLATFDEPYRNQGYVRLYFRISDSTSTRLQTLYGELAKVDTGESLRKTLDDAGRAYHTMLQAFGIEAEPEKPESTIVPPRQKPSGPVHQEISGIEEDISGMQQEPNLGRAIARMVARSPQVLVGLGIGVAAAAGADMLEGKTYLAYADHDVFRMNNLRVGARVGMWEGKSIDILWAFAKMDKTESPGEIQAPIDTISASPEGPPSDTNPVPR